MGCLIVPGSSTRSTRPGEHTGYAAAVIPGVNEAIENNNLTLTKQQLQILTGALNSAAGALEMAK